MSTSSRTVTRTIDAAPDRVWAALADLDRWVDWVPTIDAMRPAGDAPREGVGAAYVIEQPGLRRATWTVTEWDAGRSFTWQAAAPGVTSVGTHEVRPSADGRAEVVLGIRWHGPLAGLVGAAYGRKTQHYIEREAAALAKRALQV